MRVETSPLRWDAAILQSGSDCHYLQVKFNQGTKCGPFQSALKQGEIKNVFFETHCAFYMSWTLGFVVFTWIPFQNYPPPGSRSMMSRFLFLPLSLSLNFLLDSTLAFSSPRDLPSYEDKKISPTFLGTFVEHQHEVSKCVKKKEEEEDNDSGEWAPWCCQSTQDRPHPIQLRRAWPCSFLLSR